MSRKAIVPLLCFLGLVIVMAWMADLFQERVPPGLLPVDGEKAVGAVPVVVTTVPIVEPIAGTIVARQATDISSRILARIEEVTVRAGSLVARGDLLIQLEKSDLMAREIQAIEHIRSIEARLKETRAQNDRLDELLKKGMVSRSEFDASQADFDSASADLSQARQRLNEMQVSLAYSTIVAPIDGRIVDRYAEPGDTASPGVTLLSLYNPMSLRVEAHVREQLALKLDTGDTVLIEVPSLKRTVRGSIEEVVPAANAGARSFQIQVMMDYSVDMLPGMFARLLFELSEEQRILVPFDRIASVGQVDLVWVRFGDARQKRIVTTGKRRGDMIEVLSGLDESDQVFPIPRA